MHFALPTMKKKMQPWWTSEFQRWHVSHVGMLLWVTWSLPALVGLRIRKLSHSPGHTVDCSAFGSYDSAHLMGSEMPLAHRDILWGTNKPQQEKGQTGEKSCLLLPVTILHLKSSLWFASGPGWESTPEHRPPSHTHGRTPIFHQQWCRCTWIQVRGSGKHVTVRAGDKELLLFHHLSLNPAAISLWQVSRGGGRTSRSTGFWLSSYCRQALCEVNDNRIPLRHGPEWQWWRKTFPTGRTSDQTTGLSTLCGMKGDLWYGSTLTHGQWLMGWLTGQGLSKYKTGKLVTRGLWGNKPTYLWSINLWQRRQEYTVEKRQFLQQVVLSKLDSCM